MGIKIDIAATSRESGVRAATAAADCLRQTLKESGKANLIVATGSSQIEMLGALTKEPGIGWENVTGFHLDEYLGIGDDHPASFRKYLRERFVEKVPIGTFHYINTDGDASAECARLGSLVSETEFDLALIGIGENGHLAFNDPPADFETKTPYLVVQLDEACRRQQLDEGWFPTLDAVPRNAISMSVHQILKSRAIICTVPDQRKAQAVRDAVEGPVIPDLPASILQQHPTCHLFLDQAAASLLSGAS